MAVTSREAPPPVRTPHPPTPDIGPPPAPTDDAADVQRVYARVLEWGTHLGFVILAASFAVYVSGWLPPHVPLEQLPQLWDAPVRDYLARSGMPDRWTWLRRLGESDVLTLSGIAVLAAAPMLALLAAIPLYAARRARLHAAICALTLVVLLLAASAVLTPAP